MPNSKNKYPKAFYDARPAVLDRAQNRCEACGAENHKPHPVSLKMVRLQVHHKDKNPYNNDLENLRALCAICHGTENPPENRAKNGTFKKSKKRQSARLEGEFPVSKKTAKKSRKIRHQQLNRLEGEDDLSKKASTGVFIPKKINAKLNKNKKIRHQQLNRLEGEFPVSEKTKSGKKREKTEKEQGDLATKLSLAAVMKKIATLESNLKQERKERKQERKRYQQKQDQYAAARRERAIDLGEEVPKHKPGRPAKEHWQPYYEQWQPVKNMIYYKSNGKAFAPDGHELTDKEEDEILDGILARKEQNRRR
jgi:hypothetical protein